MPHTTRSGRLTILLLGTLLVSYAFGENQQDSQQFFPVLGEDDVGCSIENLEIDDCGTAGCISVQGVDMLKAGSISVYSCNLVLSEKWGDTQNINRKLVVYPAANRTCCADGTWSGPKPICSYLPYVKSFERPSFKPTANVSPKNTVDLSQNMVKSIEPEEKWKKIGSYGGCIETLKMSPTDRSATQGKTTQLTNYFLVKFQKPEYFSMVRIDIQNDLMTNVAVFAHEQDLIYGMSKDSERIQQSEYNGYIDAKGSFEHESCAIHSLAMFGEELIVRYTIDVDVVDLANRSTTASMINHSLFMFYPINQESGQTKISTSCAQIPEILNARPEIITIANEPSDSTQQYPPSNSSSLGVKYDCLAGYAIVNPVTKEKMNQFTLKCENREWFPNTSFACEPINSASDATVIAFGSCIIASIIAPLGVLYQFL